MRSRVGFVAVTVVGLVVELIGAPAGALSADGVARDLRRAASEARSIEMSAAAKVRSVKKAAKKAVATATTAVRIGTSGPTSTIPSTVVATPAVGVSPVGTYAVAELTMSFVDASRPTAANGGVGELKTRTLETTIWYPSDTTRKSTFPVLVFGHGFGAVPTDYSGLLRPVASAGYIVVAPAFPLSNKRTPNGPTLLDEPNQPGDMRFAMDQVVALGATTDSPLFGLVDGTRLAAAGHSLGGITTLDYAYSACCYDKRLKAAIPISSIINFLSASKMFSNPMIPMLLIHGDADATVPYGLGSLATYSAAPGPKALLTILKGDHTFGVSGDPGSKLVVGKVVVEAMVAFLDRYVKGDAAAPSRLQSVASAQPNLLRLDSEGMK